MALMFAKTQCQPPPAVQQHKIDLRIISWGSVPFEEVTPMSFFQIVIVYMRAFDAAEFKSCLIHV